jgi:parvulin-like peptidyl-prolyl isomerase
MNHFHRVCIIVPFLIAALVLSACEKRLPAPEPASPASLRIATVEDKKIIVAKVNDVSITMHSLIGVMNRMTQSNLETTAAESANSIRKRALDRLILEEVIFQEAKRQGLHVEQSSIDKAVANLRKNAGGEQQFQDYLTKELLTEAELRVQVERLLLIDLVFTKEVREKVNLTDDELRKEYEREKDRFLLPERLAALDILFFLSLDDPASLEKANAILARLHMDKDKDPARLTPDGTFIVRNLDFQQEKMKEPVLYEAARKLKVGELSPVIKTRDSIHILKLTDFSPESWKPYEEVKGTVAIRLKIAMQKKRRDEWERALKQSAKIEIMDSPVHAQ